MEAAACKPALQFPPHVCSDKNGGQQRCSLPPRRSNLRLVTVPDPPRKRGFLGQRKPPVGLLQSCKCPQGEWPSLVSHSCAAGLLSATCTSCHGWIMSSEFPSFVLYGRKSSSLLLWTQVISDYCMIAVTIFLSVPWQKLITLINTYHATLIRSSHHKDFVVTLSLSDSKVQRTQTSIDLSWRFPVLWIVFANLIWESYTLCRKLWRPIWTHGFIFV